MMSVHIIILELLISLQKNLNFAPYIFLRVLSLELLFFSFDLFMLSSLAVVLHDTRLIHRPLGVRRSRFTLSNARRFYLSMEGGSGVDGLELYSWLALT